MLMQGDNNLRLFNDENEYNAELENLVHPSVSVIYDGGGVKMQRDNLISFSMSGSNGTYNYVAASGMTFEEFVNNEKYNVDGWFESTDTVLRLNIVGTTKFYTYTHTKNQVITDGATYKCDLGGICCFVAGTQVMVSLDGETKNIEDIESGDLIVSYNVDTNENYLTEVKALVKNELSRDMAIITLKNGYEVEMTDYHPLLTKDGWKSLTNDKYNKLCKGDFVKTNGGYSEIVNIKLYSLEELITTYTLAVNDLGEMNENDTNDNYYANGIVAHNAGPEAGNSCNRYYSLLIIYFQYNNYIYICAR